MRLQSGLLDSTRAVLKRYLLAPSSIRLLKQWTPEKWEFPQESPDGRRKRPLPEGTYFPETDETRAQTRMGQWGMGPHLD